MRMQRLTPRFIDVHVATLDAWAGRRRPAVTSIESLVKCRLSCAVTRPYTQARIGNIAARSRGRRCEPTYQVGQVVALALMTFSMPASSMRPLCLRRCHSLFGRSSSRLDLHVAYQLSNGATTPSMQVLVGFSARLKASVWRTWRRPASPRTLFR